MLMLNCIKYCKTGAIKCVSLLFFFNTDCGSCKGSKNSKKSEEQSNSVSQKSNTPTNNPPIPPKKTKIILGDLKKKTHTLKNLVNKPEIPTGEGKPPTKDMIDDFKLKVEPKVELKLEPKVEEAKPDKMATLNNITILDIAFNTRGILESDLNFFTAKWENIEEALKKTGSGSLKDNIKILTSENIIYFFISPVIDTFVSKLYKINKYNDSIYWFGVEKSKGKYINTKKEPNIFVIL